MREVYLDHMAKTPLLPEVEEVIIRYQKERFGNPSSLHRFGRQGAQLMEEAREKVASLILAERDEIVFTSCGTESNNFALRGVMMSPSRKGNHCIVSSIEHFSVLHTARRLSRQGCTVTQLPVDRDGRVNPQDVESAITPETALISIMHASGEVGTLQPIREIAQIARKHQVLMHTDAIASCGMMPIDVSAWGVDFLSLASDQLYGPVGAAALFIRKGVKVQPFLEGGGQEEGLRSGTENVPAIVGMGKAATITRRELPGKMTSMTSLRQKLAEGLLAIEGVHLNGHPTERLPGHVSISVEGVEGESLLLALDMQGVFVGLGSACNSKAMKSSHVLQAMGIEESLAKGTVVLTLGRHTRVEDIDYVLDVCPKVIESLRAVDQIGVR